MELDSGEWLTTREAAQALGLQPVTIRSQIMLGLCRPIWHIPVRRS